MSTIITDQNVKCYRNASYSVFKGDSASISIPVKDGSDTNIDVSTGYNFDIQIKSGAGVTSVVSFTEASDEVTMGDGIITIAVPSTATSAIAANSSLYIMARLYNNSTGVTVTLLEGSFQIKESIIVRVADVDITALYGLPATLSMGTTDFVQLGVVIEPATATDKRLSWESSDTDVATVTTAGLVAAVAAGTCDVTVTSVYDEDFTATVAVTVS